MALSEHEIEEIRCHLRDDPRLGRLSPLDRIEAEEQILATIYRRNIEKRPKITPEYVSSTVKYYNKSRRRGDPYVEKIRRLTTERQQKGLPIDNELLESRRSAIKEPLEELVEREEQQAARERWKLVEREIKGLNVREQAVMKKFLDGGKLEQAERSVHYRAVKKLRDRFAA